MRRALYVVATTILLGCSSEATVAPEEAPRDLLPTGPGADTPGSTPGKPGTTPGAPAPLPDANLLEVVHIRIDGDRGFCTGTLISSTVVVTAAHCLDRNMFGSWEVVASLAPGKPSVRAKLVKMFDSNYEVVSKPDIGAMILEKPIQLKEYAQLEDVSARVQGGGKVSGAAMIREWVDDKAPLTLLGGLEASSGEQYGYNVGLVTKFFSKGGDSGAGLFLVDKGRRTHELIGVARQPEPDRDLDHFTRVDAAFISWVNALEE